MVVDARKQPTAYGPVRSGLSVNPLKTMATKKKVSPKHEPPVALKDSNPHELVHKLAFSQDNVMNAAAEQPVLFFDAAEYRVAVYRKYMVAKQELATVRAAVSLAIREAAVKAQEKTTEGLIEARVLLDDNVNIAQQACQDADVEEESSKLLLEAYRMRRDSLKVMMEWRGADLRAQQAQEFGSAFIAETSANLQERYPKG